VQRTGARFGRVAQGEVAVLFSGYTDRYYKRFPRGDRFKDRLLWPAWRSGGRVRAAAQPVISPLARRSGTPLMS
jgi:hypothetical protein